MKKLFKSYECFTVMIIVILFLLVSLKNPAFLRINNILQTVNGSVVYGLVAIGICFVLFISEIDISVGATLGMSASIGGLLILNGYGIWMALLAAIAIGIVVGLINGFGVVVLKIPSIIMTLGTNGVIRGLIYVITGGRWIEGLDFEFKALAQKSLFGMTYYYLILIILAFIIHYYLSHTLSGKSFKAIGDNEGGAQLIGLAIKKTKFKAFIICSICASVAGVLYASRVGFVTPMAGFGYEMTAIAACVIGGVSLSGGVGSIFGGVLGAILMASIARILVFIGLPSTYNDTITGLLLIVIVVVSAIINERSHERIRKDRLKLRID